VLTQLSWSGKCHATWERALTIDPNDTNVRFALLQFYLQAPGIAGGGQDKAEAQAKAIQQIDPVRGEIAWGQILRAGQKLAEAEQRYRKAADLDAGGLRGPVALASFLVSQRRWAEARGVFEARLARNTDDRFAAYQLGRLIQSEGADLAKALPFFDQYLAGPAVPDGPSHADAWFRKGEVLDALGRKAEAKAAFEAALKLVPGHPGAARGLTRLKG
jgi:tetratricopeptide (TPR) repeat protein